MDKYNHKDIESRWQRYWEENKTFRTSDFSDKPKRYVLDMFPYPSGAGLHVGHPEGYTATDILCRYWRMRGFHVLHPMGWDAFGLPAEQYAIQTGTHPSISTQKNIANFRRQIKMLGFSYDWDREINTTFPSYYRWTQWIFLQIFNTWFDPVQKKGRPIAELPIPPGEDTRLYQDRHRLAYQAEVAVNWCPELETVLANEEVVDGKSERGGHPVEQRLLRQWMLRITAYADRLLEGLVGLDWPESIKKMQREWIGKDDNGFRLRDWVFSRQRYWGEPFPILHELECGHPNGCVIADESLPVLLPENKGEIQLTRDGKRYMRETNTMPQWAGSCWYYLRYIDPHNDKAFCDPAKAKYWLPVDVYVGGAEHAVLHLLYSRFWHQILYDLGHVPTPEPFTKLINQGMILGEVEFTGFKKNGHWTNTPDEQSVPVKVSANDVVKQGEFFTLKENGARVEARGAHKMSKTRGNVINPDKVVEDYGADGLRLFEMFMGPLEAVKPWNTAGVEGVHRFLNRVWRLFDSVGGEPDEETNSQMHKTIQGVTEDLEAQPTPRFNVAISTMMKFVNYMINLEKRPKSVLGVFVQLLSPFAPHIAEELWQKLGHEMTLTYESWPVYNPALVKVVDIEVPILINGKVKVRLLLSADITHEELERVVLVNEKVRECLDGKEVKRVIIPERGKMVNLVVI